MDLPNPQLPTNADEALSALQSLTAASAHLHFTIAGHQCPCTFRFTGWRRFLDARSLV